MKKLKPDMYVQSVLDIPYDELLSKGIKLLCFDLDNTLDLPREKTAVILPEIKALLVKVKEMGFEIMIISNNTIDGRVETFATLMDYEYLEAARKPFQKKYKKNQLIQSYDKKEIIFIGDKMVTDILGAKIYGSKAILVDQLIDENNKYYTKIMGIIEIAFCYISGFKKGEYFV